MGLVQNEAKLLLLSIYCIFDSIAGAHRGGGHSGIKRPGSSPSQTGQLENPRTVSKVSDADPTRSSSYQ
jgi:hypothetical protein